MRDNYDEKQVLFPEFRNLENPSTSWMFYCPQSRFHIIITTVFSITKGNSLV